MVSSLFLKMMKMKKKTKKQQKKKMIMAEVVEEEIFTEDLIIEILSWIPAKSLLNSFKSVCKSWRILINSPVFVKMHLNRGAINGGSNNNNSLICESGNELFQLHPPFNIEEAVTNLDFPPLLSSFRLRGSCNGLLCISEDDETLILINPCTRKYKVSPRTVLPPLDTTIIHADTHQIPNLDFFFFFNGFGCCYNSTDNIDEYKVIRIVRLGLLIPHEPKHSSLYQLDIYYMSSNSWRRETRFRDYPYVLDGTHSGVFVNGALHWIAYNNLDEPIVGFWDTIVSFDLTDEEFRLVPIPLSRNPTADDPYFNIILINIKGCLSMIRFPEDDMGNNTGFDLEIWVMKEYGIKESWIKEFVISSSNSDPPRALSGFEPTSKSKAYVLKGDQILIEGQEQIDPYKYGHRQRQILYDINKRKIVGVFKIAGVHDQPNINQIDYFETLVSLQSYPRIVGGSL